MSRKQEIKEKNPEAMQDGFLVDLVDAADSAHDIKAIAQQPGGQELVRLLMKDVVQNVTRLGSSYSELTHTQFIAICAQMNERLQLARAIMNAEAREKELDEAITQALSE